jgi:hypothetical protein
MTKIKLAKLTTVKICVASFQILFVKYILKKFGNKICLILFCLDFLNIILMKRKK